MNGAVGFKPSGFTPRSRQSRNDIPKTQNDSVFGKSATNLNMGKNYDRMVQIEIEQGVPDDVKSYYTSNSQSGQNPGWTADQLNGKGPT